MTTRWPELTDGVVVLRVLDMADASAWSAGEDEEQRRWFGFAGPVPLRNVLAAIQTWRTAWQTGAASRHWGIRAEPEQTLAGGVEVRDRGDGRANISYVVFPAWRRQGVATRAVRLASAWALANLPVAAVVAVVDERNVASLGVVRAAGFVLEGPAEPWEHVESGRMLRFVYPPPAG